MCPLASAPPASADRPHSPSPIKFGAPPPQGVLLPYQLGTTGGGGGPGGGGQVPHHPPGPTHPPPPPPLKLLGPIFLRAFGRSKFSLALSASIGLDQRLSSAPLAPLKAQHHRGAGGLDPPTHLLPSLKNSPPPPHTHTHTHTDRQTHAHAHAHAHLRARARTHTHTHTRTRTHALVEGQYRDAPLARTVGLL